MPRLAGPAENTLLELCALYLRPGALAGDPVTGVYSVVFTPPLTAVEQTMFDRIVKVAASTVPGITPAEWAALESDIAGLVTFQGLPTPTLAQAILAIKAQSRILRALLRS